ncbi:MAG: hypothetical protein JNL42_16895 [Anaerolineae bacterium]|nr:hypothetical protein [Anaerolineae bacterium]
MFLMKVCRAGFLIITFGLAAVQALAQDDAAAQAKIDSALSAAPAAITQDATILDWSFDADGKFVVLREGTNGWSCLPDEPTTEVNNPLCFDEAALTWVYALVSGEAPNLTVPGFGYMLLGDEAFSNSNPGATEPAADHWMSTDPYMMFILPSGVDLGGMSHDEHSPGPFVMWRGTPYQHIMVPAGVSHHDD